MNEDIRARATRAILRSAFRSLAEAGRDVTVKSICEAAGVSRATFYAHYRDIYELMAEDEGELLGALRLDDLGENFMTKEGKKELYLRILTHMDENTALYRFYFSHQGNHDFSLVLRDILSAVTEETVRRGLYPSREIAGLSTLYHASGLLRTLRQWMDYGKNKPCTRQEYAEMLSEIS